MSESIPLQSVVVRLIRKDEVARWRQTMNRYHYLGYRSIGVQYIPDAIRYFAMRLQEVFRLLGI